MKRKHTAEFLDITSFLEEGIAPETAIRRSGEDVWQVRAVPVDFESYKNNPNDWSLVREGDLVRIRLIPYRTKTKDPAEYGLSTMDMASRLFMDFPEAIRTHIVFGKPLEDISPEDDVFRYWVGVAIQLH